MTDPLDDLFHCCALTAFLDQAALDQGWPDPENTRRRAFRYYEEALAEKNRNQVEIDKPDSPAIRCTQPSRPL